MVVDVAAGGGHPVEVALTCALFVKLKPGIDRRRAQHLKRGRHFVFQSHSVRLTTGTVSASIQKLGGWTKFYPISDQYRLFARCGRGKTRTPATPLATTENGAISGVAAQLSVITYGADDDTTPKLLTSNIAAFASTAGSSIIVVTDATTTNISDYDSVYIQTHVAIGGLILFGNYQTYAVSPTHTESLRLTLLAIHCRRPRHPLSRHLAKSTVTAGSSIVTVTLRITGIPPETPIRCWFRQLLAARRLAMATTSFSRSLTRTTSSFWSTVLPTTLTNAFINGRTTSGLTYNFGAAPGAVDMGTVEMDGVGADMEQVLLPPRPGSSSDNGNREWTSTTGAKF
jgi:hypothetical protein